MGGGFEAINRGARDALHLREAGLVCAAAGHVLECVCSYLKPISLATVLCLLVDGSATADPVSGAGRV